MPRSFSPYSGQLKINWKSVSDFLSLSLSLSLSFQLIRERWPSDLDEEVSRVKERRGEKRVSLEREF